MFSLTRSFPHLVFPDGTLFSSGLAHVHVQYVLALLLVEILAQWSFFSLSSSFSFFTFKFHIALIVTPRVGLIQLVLDPSFWFQLKT